MRRVFRIIGFSFLLLIVVALALMPFTIFPVVSGYGAKNMCSAVFIQHRNPDDVLREDFFFPISLGTFEVNMSDSSVTGSVFGMTKRKAIFRNNIGSTLVNDFSESELRKQQFLLAPAVTSTPDSVFWPVGERLPASIPEAVNKELLDSAVARVMNETTDKGNPVYTKAVVVLYDGQLVAECYGQGFDRNTRLLGWSMAKTVMAALTGILVKQGKINIDEAAPVKSWKNSAHQRITVKHLLQQTSGIDFSEVYFRPSDANTMLWSKGDMAKYVEGLGQKAQPGTLFNYSSGNVNVLSRIIRDKLGDADYYAFPARELFQKINANSFMIEPDASGTLVGSSFVYATARDYARFGLLYYNNGNWNGEQILPANWVKESTTPSQADPRERYGYLTWLNGKDNDLKGNWYPDAPADMYFADGFAGQDIFIIPSKKLVLVRLGMRQFDDNRFIREVIEAVGGRQ